MIPELGQFTLILALCVALIQATIPLYGAHKNQYNLMRLALPCAGLTFLFLSIALISLASSFLQHDFSVEYVAINSNSSLPWYYCISAVWGSHEGSLLLWVFILALWTFAVALLSKNMTLRFSARVLGVLAIIMIGFLLFMLFTSNPFNRLFPTPLDGNDLNPLLQDIGLIIHPPILYAGYVGLAVPFAFAIAALLEGRIDAAWTRWTRPWTLLAWLFLTAGITLGSWWAYYELGWGGWWFWDPVENASFMPWLIATALVHSLAVTEQRGTFSAWTVLLAILGFSLSLLGTFLVRSGVLVSVHAFATDPSRGVFILIFLCIIIGGALSLFSWRGQRLSSTGQFSFFSRETALLINNVILVVACAAVLIGTLAPLVLDALNLGKISVGPPYFDKVFAPLMSLAVILLGIGPTLSWRKDYLQNSRRYFLMLFVAAIIFAIIISVLISQESLIKSMGLMAGLAMALWVVMGAVFNIILRLRNRQSKLRGLLQLPASFIGMSLAHIGMAVFIVGVVVLNHFQIDKHEALKAGESTELGAYTFTFNTIQSVTGPNYKAQQAEITVTKNGKTVAMLYPEKRFYLRQGNPMTEAGIDGQLFRDLYVSLGEPLENGYWALRFYVKPFVRWLWLGPLLMVIGGLFAAFDKRYRKKTSVKIAEGATG